jgi:hypothetical protein
MRYARHAELGQALGSLEPYAIAELVMIGATGSVHCHRLLAFLLATSSVLVLASWYLYPPTVVYPSVKFIPRISDRYIDNY